MHLPDHDLPPDSSHQRTADGRRWRRAFNLALAAVLALVAVFSAQGAFDVRAWAVQPGELASWRGLLAAPVLHGSFEHLAANAIAVLTLGTLAGGLYPRALVRALPLAWLGAGLAAWLLGDAGSHHLGASGVTYGLMFLLLGLGLLRRDRPAVAAAMIAFLLYGGMVLGVLPREAGVSWQSHLGGAIGGLIAAALWRHADPAMPRRRYSWELEEEAAAQTLLAERDEFERPRPDDVPVLWQRDTRRGEVLPFRRPPPRE